MDFEDKLCDKFHTFFGGGKASLDIIENLF